ncbi:hypothetical protein [Olsenella sp. HMSC062G07]|uniref:hypothetical protein n=1 Tax=Olsenella sp. HMSC062G07 TaxID=1739330 RepID=UPI0008A420DF|nr:hypothetical protein [Olsenella sp. HMSC062G07]OFK25054.1 hypothetical protein HMPREF2826_00260 [Olsenella sp. HMSC062G07]
MANQNVIGLNIDDSIIKDAVTQTAKAAILQSVSDEGIAEALVREVLNIKVDKRGYVATSDYGRANGMTWLEYIVSEAIKKEVLSLLNEVVEESRPKFRKTIKAEMEKASTQDRMAEAFLDSMTRNLANSWKTDISIQFEKVDD